MGQVAGNKARARISTTKMTTIEDGYELKFNSLSWNISANVVDTPTNTDTFKKKMGIIKSGELPLKGYIYDTDNAQDLFEAGDEVYVAFYPNGYNAVGKQVLCLIENVNWSVPADGVQEFDMQLNMQEEATEINAQ